MAVPTLVATPGSATANAYCTVLEATAYHEARLSNAEWAAATADNKTISVIMATRVIDLQFLWVGYQTATTQALLWPREGVLALNALENIVNTVIPQRLKEAVAELAWNLLKADRTLDSDVETAGLTGLRAGPVELSFKDSVVAKVLPDSVFYLIPTWWGRIRQKNSSVVELVRT